MKSEFALAFNEVLEDKQLPREVILSALESAMIAAYRKSVGASAAQNVKVNIDLDSGNVQVFVEKEVAESVLDPRTEVTLEEARKFDPEAQIGDLVMVESTPTDFGRIAAQTARQAIQQKIHDAERNQQFEYFSKQVGEIVSGVVQAVNSRQATIGLDLKAEGIMERKDMIPGERFRIHERIRAYLYEVTNSPKGLQIKLSHTHRNFLRRLLENEVPEIYHGIVEIRSIAREPGQRAKVAVSATQSGIDPVGACVGQRGVRIQAIVNELHGEKIDVIEWSSDPAVFISKAVSPARVTGVYLNHPDGENKTATVVVPEDQLSLAIGKEGQNARLAAKLTGWRIDIMSVSEAASKALVKLHEDASLAELAQQEAETVVRVQELLKKKEEGGTLTLEETSFLARFVDRVQRHGEAIRREEDAAEQARIQAVKETIDPRAFDISILDVPLREHTIFILQEAGIETLGDLMLTAKLDPDEILGYNGIGPRTFEEIMELVNTFKFPEEAPAEVLELTPEETQETLTGVAELAVEVEPQAETEQPEAEEVTVAESEPEQAVALESEESEEKSFEELFNMDTLLRSKEIRKVAPEDEELTGPRTGKKSKGKKKKGHTVEYDPDKDESFVRYKHRKDDGWDEDW
ncbi:MAG TPA: transcription termination factor NusA [Anaerolineaceae bacterium]|nr:transcription termination factor NusA [Anaerolineaceae bacterium]